MTLTEKQKRFIISPHSFLPKQQKMWRQIIRKKISHITQDFEFITQHRDEISQILGESIPISNDMIKSTEPETMKSDLKNQNRDPDFL